MNWSGGLIGRARPARSRLDVNELLATARHRALLEDFGPPGFREGLDRLVDSLNEEAELNFVGRRAMRAQVLQLLMNRLRIRDWVKKHPYIRHELIEGPLIVTGLPRTGATLLSGVLNEDPHNRSLLRWEAVDPCPPPNIDTYRDDPRVEAARHEQTRLDSFLSPQRAIQPMDATAPTECVTLLASDFASLHFETQAWIPAYAAWLDDCDMVPSYEHHRLQLMMFQEALPTDRWALKSPMHLWHLEALRAVYPDARLVWTHRDPVKVVPSVASLATTLNAVGSDVDRTEAIARSWFQKCAHAVEVGERARTEFDDECWFDLPYAELIDDPVGAVERMYVHFGLDLSQLGRRRMQAYVDAHPQDRHGRHEYDAGQFGLTDGEIRERFADYTARREVPSEG